MSRARLLALLLGAQSLVGAPSVIAAQPATGEPSTAELAASVTVYDLSGTVTVYDLSGSVTVLQTEEQVGDDTVVSISSDVLFDFASAALTPAASDKVKELAARITGTTRPVTVVAHTDSVGDDAYNLTLSKQRAEAVGAVLRTGVPAGTQIAAEGRGSREPVAPNSRDGKDDPTARAKNRRVTISFAAPAR